MEDYRTGATAGYDPFGRGQFPVGVRTIQALDKARDRLFPCEIWYPESPAQDAAAQPGLYPLIVFSHHSGGHRRAASFLCTHLSSHGYVVAAMDHSEVIAPELARRAAETPDEKAARFEAVIANRVPDVRFLLDHLLTGAGWDAGVEVDPALIGIVGHSLGGWTALSAADADSRIRAVVALAPGGSSQPRPGILPVRLSFSSGRDVPTLYLVGEEDVSIPLTGVYEIFERTPGTKQLIILRRADHMHFMDNVEEMHEMVRNMPFPPELSWLPREMRPIAELCSGEQAHLFVRGLTLCHMDAVLRNSEEARRVLRENERELAARGVEAIIPKFGGEDQTASKSD